MEREKKKEQHLQRAEALGDDATYLESLACSTPKSTTLGEPISCQRGDDADVAQSVKCLVSMRTSDHILSAHVKARSISACLKSQEHVGGEKGETRQSQETIGQVF